MGKPNKFVKGKGRPAVSAFATYSQQSESLKRERVESSASLREPIPIVVPSLNVVEKSEDAKSLATSSIVKQLSNKTKLSFSRVSMKRKKKLKKTLPKSSIAASTHWRPPCLPIDDFSNVCHSVMKFSDMKDVVFSATSNKLERNNGDSSEKSSVDIKENGKICKERRSIELSTSRSLTGCEDDDEEATKTSNTSKTRGEGISLEANRPPPKKKFRVESHDVLLRKLNKNDESDVENDPQPREDTSSTSQASSSSRTVTISKKLSPSDLKKMPSSQRDSEKDGRSLFEWLLQPFSVQKFFKNIWEKKPLFVGRQSPNYAEGLFTSSDLNRILSECNVRFGVNLDVTTYENDVRETHNVEGRAYPSVVWDFYNNGCSVRIKNPQAFSKPVWKLCSTLQEYFKSMVGANIYLTPPGTQGFAPHYDDIEAFVLQLEGKKKWNLYNPLSTKETLPRHSSRNFKPSEIGEAIYSTTLEPGDLLYFPRGFIHQAKSLPDAHSLHITISTYQRNTWGDVMEELVPAALSKAISEDVEFRKGVPLDLFSCIGVQNSHKDCSRRKQILSKVSQLFSRLADQADVDVAVDQKAVEFLHAALPPVFTEEEKKHSIQSVNISMTSPGCPSPCLCVIELNTKMRVVRKNALRVCVNYEEDPIDGLDVRVYHSVQNSRVYHEEEKKFFYLSSEHAAAVEFLVHSYPEFAPISSLPLSSNEDKINLATMLFEKGILTTESKVKMRETV